MRSLFLNDKIVLGGLLLLAVVVSPKLSNHVVDALSRIKWPVVTVDVVNICMFKLITCLLWSHAAAVSRGYLMIWIRRGIECWYQLGC